MLTIYACRHSLRAGRRGGPAVSAPRPEHAPDALSGGADLAVLVDELAFGKGGAAAALLAWYLRGGGSVETDNAYVKSDKVAISAEVAGPVTEVLVRERVVRLAEPTP